MQFLFRAVTPNGGKIGVLLLRPALSLFLFSLVALAAPLPPLVCPAGGPIGSVDLRVASARGGEPLPLRTINRLEEADRLLYHPLLRSGEERKGEVAVVLVPANKTATGEKLVILDPKPAGKPQEWSVPWRVAVVAFVYGPSGLNSKKVRTFLERDDELVAQLADYAEKTAQTEALIAALSSPVSSAVAVQSALQGFSAQYGLAVQIDRSAPPNQQAMTLFRALNPAIASYDPISPQGAQQVGQTAGLATSVATLFFGSPVGLAAGGTAMLLELRSVAFPRTEFRSSFSQSMPNEGLGLCGRRDPAPPHTRIAYLWASRVPNVGPPQLSIDRENSLPAGLTSPLPVSATDADWKFIERARAWALQPENGKPIPINVHKLGNSKTLDIELGPQIRPGKYTLVANWDWDHFETKGAIEVRPLSNFASARLLPASQDLLVARTGKAPVTLEGSDFEFVTKVEIEKLHDKFATPAPAPFVLPRGLRKGPQDRMDIQVNTIDLDPGEYRLIISQTDGVAHSVPIAVLAPPPTIENLPVVLNQGSSTVEFELRGHRLGLLKRVEVANGTVELAHPCSDDTRRKLKLQIPPTTGAGTSLALKAYIENRSEPLTFADAVRIAGPRPNISSITIAQPPDQDVQLGPGELPGGMYLSALMRVEHVQSNSAVTLACDQPASAAVTVRLGERSGPLSLQQLAPDQMFLSFDTSAFLNGCRLGAKVENGREGDSDIYPIGQIVRVPKIERFELTPGDASASDPQAILIGQNLETIEKVGWTPETGTPVLALPLPVAGDGVKQSLQIRLPSPPDPRAALYVWLRGESTARATRVHP